MKFARIASFGLVVLVAGAAPLARGEDKKKDMNEIGNRKVAHRAMISQAVFVLHGPGQHIGDRFDAAVWMPWKARQIILRHIIAKIVQQ